MKTKIIILILMSECLLGVCPAAARIGWYPDFDELAKKADVVVIAQDTAVCELTERSKLPNIHPDIEVIEVETSFKVVAVLKGEIAKPTFLLHHYRLPTPTAAGWHMAMGAPGLVIFLGDKQTYLMFLTKEPDGRYAPGSGQTDPNFSIRPVGSEMWTFERGNLFVPVFKSLLFWLFLVILLPVVLLVCSIIYMKKRKQFNNGVHGSPASSAP